MEALPEFEAENEKRKLDNPSGGGKLVSISIIESPK